MASFTVLGDGVLTLGETPVAFEGEVLGASITHEYDEADQRRMLSGDVRSGTATRTDGLTASVENDLTAAGLYAYLEANDMTDVPMSFTPNSADGAEWTGTVTCRLPGSIGADEYGTPIVSDVELPGVGKFTFTPAT
jgi:hypothetical protein